MKTNYYNIKKTSRGFDSKFEERYSWELDLKVKTKAIKRYETQIPIPLVVNSCEVCKYIMDFVVYHNDGSMEYVETKGFPTEVWKIKWKLLKAMIHNDKNIKATVIFQTSKFREPKIKILQKK